jgi:hypothetical protein
LSVSERSIAVDSKQLEQLQVAMVEAAAASLLADEVALDAEKAYYTALREAMDATPGSP